MNGFVDCVEGGKKGFGMDGTKAGIVRVNGFDCGTAKTPVACA
jgi:hypothetical protein